MGVDMKVKAIYDSEIGNITRSEKNWKDVLKVAGQLYRYEFDNIVMVTAQRPPEKSTLMADYDTWKKVGRYVKRGAKGCAIFPSRALNPRMRYIFDISDTGGKNVKLTWDLEGENLKDYVDFLVSGGQIEQYDNSDRESLKNILKQFTGTDVWLIIKEEFGDRMTELMQLSGSVIKEESKKRNGLQQEMDMEQLVYASVMYAVGTRCGFDLSVQEQDFSQIVNIKDEEIIYRLGSIVCDVSCSVLREFSRNLKAIESERRIGYVRRNDLQGSGRTALSADRDAGRDGGSHEAGQIRKDGDELSKGERAGKIQDADEIREDVREDVSGRGGSEPAVRPAGDAVSGEAQATESVIDNGDVEDKRAGEDAGRGSGTESDSDAIPLESDDTELNRELDEINSLGVSKEAEYTQASFFFDQNGQASIGTIHTEDENNNQFMRQFEQDRKAALAGKYNYLNPKKSATVPGEYIKQVLMRGTGFIGGKGRVCKIFETEIDAGTRAKRIKAEYGQGGAGWPVDGLGLHGYDTFHGNGLRFQWKDEDGEVEGYVSWKDIEKELGVLIHTGEYQPETPRIDELAMDGLREDDEVIDAEYREVEPEEAESEIDDYAIPDEPESYASNRDYVSAKGMTPQETADEDRMVTQAEYGAEIEAETTEKDPSELQYITPIDYAKRIAELDEDLGDAAEILVTDCSCYTPFRAYPSLMGGEQFNPLTGSEVLPMYQSVADKLCEQYGYSGIYVVFDEFSKFIEGQEKHSIGGNMKFLQDMCELANESKDTQIYMTMVAHKSIKEYGAYLSEAVINAFIGIEGRIEEVLFNTSSKNSYELIQNAIETDTSRLAEIPEANKYFGRAKVDEYYKIPAFRSTFTNIDFEEIIVKGCYPLSPVSAYALLNISEKVAQNERTLFTFISKEEPKSMAQYVVEHTFNNEWIVTPDKIYDYFQNLFKKEIGNERVHTEWLNAEYAIAKAKETGKIRMLKTLAVINIINKFDEMPPTEEILKIASGLPNATEILNSLVAKELIYKKETNNCYVFKTRAGASLKSEIKRRRVLKDSVNLSKVFSDVSNNQYILPKRYNNTYSMTRYFRFEYLDVVDFLKLENVDVLLHDGKFQDGKVVALYSLDNSNRTEQIMKKVAELNILVIIFTEKGNCVIHLVIQVFIFRDMFPGQFPMKDDKKMTEQKDKHVLIIILATLKLDDNTLENLFVFHRGPDLKYTLFIRESILP